MFNTNLLLFCFTSIFLFSSHVTANIDAPDYYQEPGYNSFREYKTSNIESIDTFSGQLTISHTDLFLPGNGGLDLEIIRSYNTDRARRRQSGKSIVGNGWDIHMGRVYTDNEDWLFPSKCRNLKAEKYSHKNPVLELPDGTKKLFYTASEYNLTSSDGQITQERAPDFISKDFWVAHCIEIDAAPYTENGRTYAEGGLIVTSPQGISYHFTRIQRMQSGRSAYVATSITDARGNSISIKYHIKPEADPSLPDLVFNTFEDGTVYGLIDEITTSDDRRVKFNYVSGKSFPKYNPPAAIDSFGPDLDFTSPILSSIEVLPKDTFGIPEQVVTYNYVDYPRGAQSKQAAARSNQLKTIVTPEGMSVTYDYDYIDDYRNALSLSVIEKSVNKQVESNVLRFSIFDFDKINTGTTGTWQYFYDRGSFSGPDYDKTTIILPTGNVETYKHHGRRLAEVEADFGVGALVGNGTFSGKSDSIWKIGLLLEKTIGKAGEEPSQIETYEWDSMIISGQDEKRFAGQNFFSDNTYIPLLKSKIVTRDTSRYTTKYSDYDILGNPQSVVEIGNDTDIPPISFLGTSDPLEPYKYNQQYIRKRSIGYHHNLNLWIIGQSSNEQAEGDLLEGNTFFDEPPIYDTLTLPNGEIDSGSQIIRNYFENGLLRQLVDNGVVSEFTYDGEGNLLTTTDANGHITQLSDYYRGIPRREENANGAITTREVDYLGRVTSQTDGRGNVTAYTYDKVNRVRSIQPAIGSLIEIDWPQVEYSLFTKADLYTIPAQTDLSFRYTEIHHNKNDRVLTRGGFIETLTANNQGYEISRALSGEEAIGNNKTYDVTGRLIFESYPNSTEGVTYTYDSLNRIKSKLEPGRVQLYDYKSNNRVEVTNGEGHITQYFYRAFGDPDQQELMAIVEPEGTSTVIKRDIVGNVVQLEQNGLVRDFKYDIRKFLISETNPETGLTQYAHDNVGNVTSKEINSQGIWTYIYDDINRLVSISYPSTYFLNNQKVQALPLGCPAPCSITTLEQLDELDYDNNNNVTESSRTMSRTIVKHNSFGVPSILTPKDKLVWDYTYDENNNLIEENFTRNNEAEIYGFKYEYNQNNVLSNIEYPSGFTIDYLPDNYGRPTRVGEFVNNIVYYPTGEIDSMTYGNGITTSKKFFR